MSKFEIPFIEQNRQTTFDWHISQVLKWLKFDDNRKFDSTLVYASIDLRIAIERYIFELLDLLKSGNFSEAEKRKCRSINGVFALMRETDPNYRKTAEFTLIIASITPEFPEISIVDTGYLRRKWEDLSEYCHKQIDPSESFESPNREWQIKGFELIDEIIAKFKEWKFESNMGICLPETMGEETKYIYEKFLKNDISSSQAKRMLQIIDPIMRRRFARRIARRIGARL